MSDKLKKLEQAVSSSNRDDYISQHARIINELADLVYLVEERTIDINRALMRHQGRLDKIEEGFKTGTPGSAIAILVDKEDLKELKAAMSKIYWSRDIDVQIENRDMFDKILKKYGV